jgi:hypothetical protein
VVILASIAARSMIDSNCDLGLGPMKLSRPEPRWLAAALKGGKKLEYFSVAESAKKEDRPD